MTSQTTFTSCMHDQMLESNRDDVKLEAMRCVTVMTAKGKLSLPRTLFPHIVKNISSKNPELKKLIYLYLTNFADQEPDMALLPVATLQKSLKSPNPLVRSSALKVLTSMRLSILSAILMATLRNSVNDLSPYVRKTVAHSIIKIHRLEPDIRDDLIEYIERLFNDKNSMVLSSAVATFEIVCPERLDLVHKHYRRFCFILADCSEWGQTLMIKLLQRYILDTYKRMKSGKLVNYNSSEHDPKILLRAAKPLVHSNNSAVVMAVIKLYISIANHNEVRSTVTKPLIRLLRSHREIEITVLSVIEDLTRVEDAIIDKKSGENDNEIVDKVVDEHSLNSQNSESPKPESLDQNQPDDEDPHQTHINKEECELEQTLTRDGYIPLDDGSDEQATHPSLEATSNHVLNDRECPTENGGNGTANDELVEEVDGSEKKIRSIDMCTTISDTENDEDEDGDEEDGEDDEDEDEDEDDDEDEDEDEDEDDDEDGQDEEEEEEEVIVNESNLVESDKEDSESKRELDFSSINLESNMDSSAYIEIFRPHLKSFFVKHNDCTQIRLIKLKILTNLSSSVNVSQVLRELQAYIATYVDDKEFVSGAIHAMGRCAMIVKEVAHTCLNGLTHLLSNSNEHIVSEAIVVLRSQIINKNTAKNMVGKKRDEMGEVQSNENKSEKSSDSGSLRSMTLDPDNQNDKMVSTVIKQVTKLLPTVTAPQARATILWILAEFCDKNRTAAKCAPNVLRLIAKSFCQEDNFVKLQSLTLASKFLLSLNMESKADLHHKVHLLAGYLFSLAKYDINHDVRDRGRFLKKLLEDENICTRVLHGTAIKC